MSEITLESLGLSKDEITERVVERITDRVLTEWVDTSDEEETGYVGNSKFQQALEEKVVARMNKAVEEIAAKNVLPNVASYVESLTLQETNKWGEKIGKAMSFTEYLVQRAEHYMTEKVDYQGKPKGQDSFSWRPSQTRISHMIHEHLHYRIENAMKEALANANNAITEGLRKTVEIKLAEIAKSTKVEVKTR